MFRCQPLPSYYYLILVTIVVLLLGTSGHGACQCHQDQSAALLRLKTTFHFDAQFAQTNLSSWKVDTNCCMWEGVTCDGPSGYVTALNLSNLFISGSLSSSDIFRLTSLRFLSLARNNFDASPWPSPGFELLADLEYLDLSYSGLSGDLHIEKGQLSNLVTLNLSGLVLEDFINLETLIHNLGSLQTLYLRDAYILVRPTDLARTSSANTTSGLKELSMGMISDGFDTFLTNNLLFHPMLANLVTLDLSYFDLTNLSLHALIGSLGNLENLYLQSVTISVSQIDLAAYASSINTISRLKELRMQQCTIIGGHLDTFLAKLPFLSNLVKLDLSVFPRLKNLSLGALIDNLGSLKTLYLYSVNIDVSPTRSVLHHSPSTNTTPGLQELSMQGCTITGRIDSALAKFRFLSKLILDGSKFSGPAPVPERFKEFSSLTVLSLQSCGLTGTFPPWIFHIKSLAVLDVSGNKNLCGELPEFIQGSALQVLRLSGTKFSGEIPVSISNLRNLIELDLSNCQFHGQIPPFAQCPMISSIDLSGNNLNGSLPSDSYLALHNLINLVLRNNSISGVIPASLFSHTSLEVLDLSRNNFTGNFLLYPNISSKLAKLDVSNNKLQGPIPKLLSQFVGLQELDLSSNNFTGTVDLSFMKNIKNLQFLSLSYNKLSVVEEDGNHSYMEYPRIWDLGLASCNLSYVPKFLMQQSWINYLDLSNNNIGGHIPDWIWGNNSENVSFDIHFGIVFALNLSHNLFTSVAADLSNATFLDLDLHSNMIKGALPLPPLQTYRLDYSNNHFNSSIKLEFWSRISHADLLSLSLANNSLTGEVSHLICNTASIEVLDLSFNNFSGLIPPCLLKHKWLQILNLRGNDFNGSLPQDIDENCALQIIDLNGNKLEGKLPMSLRKCHMLQVLDVGNNLIMDTYPEWLGVLPLLKVLVLRSNKFHGPIDYYGMNKLQVLDLSSNSFNGSIPTRFLKQFKAMMVVSSGDPSMYVGIIAPSASASALSPSYRPYYMESITVTLKGQETTLVQILSVFMSIDLSNNSFEGTIPDEIGDLKLLNGLNLSRNSFIGRIPRRIANMKLLESLDLSDNQLSGEIPPAMAQMSFLEVLNLSYNRLSGLIPQSGQFSTFPDTSFLGNDGLCGKPLPRLCDPNDGPPAAATPGSSKELSWEILSVEAGVISGLAIVVATTLLWGNGRRWLYWHVDKSLLYVLEPWIDARRH